MKKNLLKIIVVAVCLFIGLLNVSAQYVDENYYGFEKVDKAGDGTADEDSWYIHTAASSNMSIADSPVAGGSYSLKIGTDDWSTAAGAEWRTDCAKNTITNLTGGNSYLVSIKVFIPSSFGTGDNVPLKQFKTIYEDGWKQTVWNVEGVTARDKWVTLWKEETLSAPTVDKGRFQIRVVDNTSYKASSGGGYIYLDDLKIVDPINIDNSSNTVMGESYFSFESGDGSWWVPTNQRANAYIQSDIAATGNFSLKFTSDDYSTIYNTLDVQPSSTEAYGGALVLNSGQLYNLSLKVRREGDIQPDKFLTNIKSDANGVGYQTVSWDISDVSQIDEWVEVNQTIMYIASKDDVEEADGTEINTVMAMKFQKENIPETGSGSLYLDDILMEKVTDPTILTESYLNSFTTAEGVASVAQSFKVLGGNLTEGITVAAPIGYEVSLEADANYGASVILPLVGTRVEETSVFVRIKDNVAKGDVTGTVSCTSTGATLAEIALSGTVTVSTDVYDVNTNAISIYPNPASDFVNVVAQPSSNICVYAVTGKLIKEIEIKSEKSTINVSDLTSGIYLIKVTTGKESYMEKIQVL